MSKLEAAIEEIVRRIIAEKVGEEPELEEEEEEYEESETEEQTYDKDDIKELCADLDEDELATAKSVFKEHGYKSPGHVDDDYDNMDALYVELAVALGYEIEGSVEDDAFFVDEEGEEITIEACKIACQAFAKENGKDDLIEILEPYDIKTVRGLKSLDAEQLAELYNEVSD